MSTVSELFPAGGGDNTIDMVASGTLPNGSPVILKADGTVEVVDIVSTNISESIPAGEAAVFSSGAILAMDIAFDPSTSGSFVAVYQDKANSDYGTVAVGTVSGTVITFGTSYVFNSSNTDDFSVEFNPNDAGKFVIAYSNASQSQNGTALVGTVSGTSVTFGSNTTFSSSGESSGIDMAFSPTESGKFIVSYADSGNTRKGTAVVGTVSGASISFGAEYIFNSGTTLDTAIAFDPNTAGSIAVVFKDYGNSYYGTAAAGTVSGTSITFGAEYIFNSNTTDYLEIAFDPNTAGKFVVVYQNGSGNDGTAIVGTVSGNSITFGYTYEFETNTTSYNTIAFDPDTANTFVVAYQNSNYSCIAVLGTISGTTISFGTKHTISYGKVRTTSIAFDTTKSGRFVVAYMDDYRSDYGTAKVCQLTATRPETNSASLLGISQDSAVDGETVAIETLGGYVDNQSGLTIGSDYYVAADGTLTTTSTDNVSIGKAVNATSINMRDYV